MPGADRKRTDGNQTVIQRTVETVGRSWQSIAMVGHGAPDTIIGGSFPCPHCRERFPQNLLWEIKNPEAPPSKRELTKAERIWHDRWLGQVEIIETQAEALEAMGVRSR